MRVPWTGRSPRLTLAVGMAILALVLVAGAANPADRRAAINDVPLQGPVATLTTGAVACQPEVVPAQARRVRVAAAVGPGALRARATVRTGGRQATGAWTPSERDAIVVALPAGIAAGPAEICIQSAGPVDAQVLGSQTGERDRLRLDAGTGAGRMRFDYLYGTGPQPLWAGSLGALPDRIAAANGSAWAPWVAGFGLVLAVAGLVAVVAGPPGRRELLAVAVLALGSGMSWAGTTPLSQSTDELAHAAYVQAFGELGHPPRDIRNTGEVSDELACWATVTRFAATRFFAAERPPWRSPAGDPCADADPRKDAAQYQAVQPPAYYAMAMVGYRAARLADRPLPDRLLLARLVSVLLAAVTAVSALLLVREAFADSPWPARAAAVAAGLQPVLIFNHSVINSDALVIASTTAIAAVLARIWRRGPTLRRALALGGLLALGVLAKINFLIVVPCAVAVQLLIWLRWKSIPLRRRALLLGVSWLAALLPAVGYAAFSDAIWEPSVQDEARVAPPVNADRLRMASYLWQTFLPPLPFMNDLFPNERSPAVDAMLFGTTTRLGWWNDYGIGAPWSTLILLGAGAIVVGAAVVAVRRRAWRAALAVAVGVTAVYTVLLVASLYLPNGLFQVQGRYLLPLTFAWALAAGTAVAALGPRLQGHAVAALGVAMLGWSALAAHATLLRWYL